MSTWRAILLVAGAVCEFVGVVAIAWPDAVPYGRRFAVWLDDRWRIMENLIRRLLRRRPRHVTHTASAGGAIVVGGSVRGIVGVGEGATLEEKVEYLLRRDHDSQHALTSLTERVAAGEAAAERRQRDLRVEFRQHVDDELTAAFEADRPLRFAGSFLLAVGLVCATVASFL